MLLFFISCAFIIISFFFFFLLVDPYFCIKTSLKESIYSSMFQCLDKDF